MTASGAVMPRGCALWPCHAAKHISVVCTTGGLRGSLLAYCQRMQLVFLGFSAVLVHVMRQRATN